MIIKIPSVRTFVIHCVGVVCMFCLCLKASASNWRSLVLTGTSTILAQACVKPRQQNETKLISATTNYYFKSDRKVISNRSRFCLYIFWHNFLFRFGDAFLLSTVAHHRVIILLYTSSQLQPVFPFFSLLDKTFPLFSTPNSKIPEGQPFFFFFTNPQSIIATDLW